jgi:hypothetical protein
MLTSLLLFCYMCFFASLLWIPIQLLVLLVSYWFTSSAIITKYFVIFCYIADPPGRSAICLGLVVNRQPYLLGLLEFSGTLLMLPSGLVRVLAFICESC